MSSAVAMSAATTTALSPSSSTASLLSAGGVGGKKRVEMITSDPVAGRTVHEVSDNPLPPILRRVMQEVARTGRCSSLSWSGTGGTTSTFDSPSILAPSLYLKANSGLYTTRSQRAKNRRRGSSSSLLTNPHGPSSPLHSGRFPPRRKANGIRGGGKSPSKRKMGDSSLSSPHAHSSGSTVPRSRKRPLVRLTPSVSGVMSTTSGGRTSGSEMSYDESTQYECDSEGTSATSNSEFSLDRRESSKRRIITLHNPKDDTHPEDEEEEEERRCFKSLKEAVRTALGLVLDHYFRNRGGYKVTMADRKKNSHAARKVNPEGNTPSDDELAFLKRKQLLLSLVADDVDVSEVEAGEAAASKSTAETAGSSNTANPELEPDNKEAREGSRQKEEKDTGPSAIETITIGQQEDPPFTIQRVAEVLVTPIRYYTQTHKLCNCLEKLLLITSSTSAFGGSAGGECSQSIREVREMVALADERGREQSEKRQRRLRRRLSSASSPDGTEQTREMTESSGTKVFNGKDHETVKTPPTGTKIETNAVYQSPSSSDERNSSFKSSIAPLGSGSNGLLVHSMMHSTEGVPGASVPVKGNSALSGITDKEELELEAKTSLQNRFETMVQTREGETSGSVDSKSTGQKNLATEAVSSGSEQEQRRKLGNDASKISTEASPGESVELEKQRSGIHRAPSPIVFSGSTDTGAAASPLTNAHAQNMQALQIHHNAAMAGVNMMLASPSLPMEFLIDPNSASPSLSGIPGVGAESAEFEGEQGRSSASNSDVDSESGDDVSLDDSASDGSDSGSHYEPFSAARVMALNRMQQQQRLQSRAMALSSSALNQQQNDGFRPPPDSEYQSGDSIDSMIAEDSGESDSSSSDFAD